MGLSDDQKAQIPNNMILCPNLISDAIIDQLFLDTSPQAMLNYVSKPEWKIYSDFPNHIKDVEVPSFYNEIK